MSIKGEEKRENQTWKENVERIKGNKAVKSYKGILQNTDSLYHSKDVKNWYIIDLVDRLKYGF